METVTTKIESVVNEVQNTSFYEKTHIQTQAEQEEIINNFLDGINSFKKKLKAKSAKIELLTTKCEEITWLTNLKESELKQVNEVIAASKDLRSTLIREYLNYTIIRQKGIAKAEIKEFKHTIDDFTAAY